MQSTATQHGKGGKSVKKLGEERNLRLKVKKKIEKKPRQPATKNHCTERRVVVLVGFPFPCVHEGGRHSFTALPKSGNWANIPKRFRKTEKKWLIWCMEQESSAGKGEG